MEISAEGFDVIGDVHGQATKLEALLHRLGYEERDGVWRHPDRRAIFVGDLIDRGPEQLRSVLIAKRMQEAGSAFVLMGNHEFNAISFHTPDPDDSGQYLRRHTKKNRNQHRAFIEEIGIGTLVAQECIRWFKSLPLWLEIDGLRVVHACWSEEDMNRIRPMLSGGDSLTDEAVVAANRRGSDEWQAVEHLLKGPEIDLDIPYLDKDGHERSEARFKWWSPDANRLSSGALIPPRVETTTRKSYPTLDDRPIEPPVAPYRDPTPVLYGHYWHTGIPAVTGEVTACVDYSAGKGGPLVAYRWSGEPQLADDRFVSSP